MHKEENKTVQVNITGNQTVFGIKVDLAIVNHQKKKTAQHRDKIVYNKLQKLSERMKLPVDKAGSAQDYSMAVVSKLISRNNIKTTLSAV